MRQEAASARRLLGVQSQHGRSDQAAGEWLRPTFELRFGRCSMATVLVPIPDRDFDPTETGVPWRTLRQRRHHVVFATPDGKVARADPRMVTGEGLGVWAPLMRANKNGRSAYQEMSQCEEFRHPIPYDDIRPESLDGIILPGGHARGCGSIWSLTGSNPSCLRAQSAGRSHLPRCASGGALSWNGQQVGSIWKDDDRSHQVYGADGLDAHLSLRWRLLSDLFHDRGG